MELNIDGNITDSICRNTRDANLYLALTARRLWPKYRGLDPLPQTDAQCVKQFFVGIMSYTVAPATVITATALSDMQRRQRALSRPRPAVAR